MTNSNKAKKVERDSRKIPESNVANLSEEILWLIALVIFKPY